MRIFTLGIVVLMLFVLNPTVIKDNPNTAISKIEASVEPSEKLVAESLSELANRKFSIKEDQNNEEDYDSIVTFGKAFVNLYTGAVAKQETVSFENYISSANLLKFTDKMLELTQKQALNGASSVNFGLDNEFNEEVINKIDKNLYYLSLPFSNEGSGLTCTLLVQSSNKSLEIVDLYFGYKDGVDTFTTGHPAERNFDNPQIWDDQEWVDGVFEKLEQYEAELSVK
ncbi:hypothetical protein M2444_001012 [Paenibacillus sp. PastF-3]|uniref:hypothetical protein n=1 Tax=unclassified Paenibacillus TaxID=185978 RepID=UPI0024761BCA|nr:hypothetical protein [Paenibacillus sp. PastF-3]MDH6369234.1 hypothetical protein [Paenibacillus sp. PastF-3]